MDRYYKYSYATETERDARQRERELAHKKLMGLVPRKSEGRPTGQSPFGLGVAAGLSQRDDDKDKTIPKNVLHPKPKPKKVSRPYKNQGQLVRQVTPGALRKNPNPIQALIDAIWAFFGGRENRPEPVDRFMVKYPKPATTANLSFADNVPIPSTS